VVVGNAIAVSPLPAALGKGRKQEHANGPSLKALLSSPSS